ncbi:hypothetical protein BC828DRAFT_93930 [Blastocladiella britannica]|nr:hypothetical protein BC828DRAFT_93930 [Blastocladiella britannica]
MTSATSTTTPPSQSQQQPRTTSSVLYLARPLSQSYLSDNTDFEMVEHETDPFMPAATSSPPPPSSASSASAAAVAAAAIAYQQQQHQQHQHQQQQHEQQHQEAIAAPLAPPTAPPPHPPMPDPTTTSTSSHRTMTPTPTPMALLDQLDPEVSAQVREVGWSLLERFSHVTQATRATAARLLDHPLSQPLMPVLPRNVQALSSTYRAEDHPGAPLEEMARELPAAGAYLARWVSGAAAASVTVGKGEGRSSTEVWEDDSDEESDLGGFGVISTASSMPKPVSKRSPAKMLSAEMWIQYESSGFRQSIPIDGNDTTEDVGADDPDANRDLDISAIVAQVKERIFLGGIDRDVRPQVYKYLLGVLPWGATPDEREAIMRDKRFVPFIHFSKEIPQLTA